MPQQKPEHIICFALPAWHADYLRSTVELMKCLSHNNLVLYVDYAYTIVDVIKGITGKKKLEWKKILGLQQRLRKINGNNDKGLYLLSLPPVLPAFASKTFKQFMFINKINALVTGYFINRAAAKLKMRNIIGINSFQPFLGLWWKIKHLSFLSYYCYDDFVDVLYFKGFAKQCEKDFIAKTDLLIVTSEELQTRKKQGNIPVEVVHNGVHFHQFNQHINKQKNNNTKVVGYTGSIDNRIDIDLLDLVIKEMPDFDFVFIGKVFDQEAFKRLSRYQNVKFMPPVASDEIPALMSSMHVGIIPYKLNALTAAIHPLKVNEYLAMGMPVVMTPFANVAEADVVVYKAATSELFKNKILLAFAENSLLLQQQRISVAHKADWQQRANKLESIIKKYKAKKQELRGIKTITQLDKEINI